MRIVSFAGGVLIFFAVIAGGLYIFKVNASQNSGELINPYVEETTVTATATPTPVPTSIPVVKKSPDFGKLTEEYKDIRLAVVYENMKTGERNTFNGDDEHIAASTTKLIPATYTLRQIEAGKVSFDDKMGSYTVKWQLQQMVNQSNNISWELFYEKFGRSTLQTYARSIGMKNFTISKNTMTAEDMAVLLKKIYKKELLNEENNNYLLSLMQKTEDDSFIPNAKTRPLLRHKNGKLETNVNEAVINTDPDNPFIMAIYSEGNGVWGYAERAKLFHLIIESVM
jgi:beta-lactamase class A